MQINLKDFCEAIRGHNLTPAIDMESIELEGAYVSDMLSDVMGSAKPNQAWITIMKHLNTIAVASMTGVPVIIYSSGNVPEAPVIEKALEESVCLVSSGLPTFDIAGILYKLLGL
ncbi:MAG TPA: hypothetical protein P5533_06060 [Candidatus Cloacimonadota bacterium]|nr:hypothetical protein [Candidatus Cloacimonadota bacterium]